MPLNKDYLAAGSIIFEFVYTTTPPKPKYYIIIGISEDKVALGTVFINSEINKHIFPTQKLKELHVLMPKEDNPFLDHDSYIDCSDIKERLCTDVVACMEAQDGKYGYTANLDPATHASVNEVLKNAPTISPYKKKKYRLV
jgi:hypothetical protein